MATVNPWTRFKRLLPQSARYTVTIETNSADGTSLALRRDGELVRLQGTSVAPGNKAWVEGRQIIGEAPDLPGSTEYV